MDFDVTLLTLDYDAEKVKKAFHFSESVTLSSAEKLPKFKPLLPKGMAFQRTLFAKAERKRTRDIYREYDIIFHTQAGHFLGPPERRTFNVFYDPSDLLLIQKISESDTNTTSGPPARPWKRPYYFFLRQLSNNDDQDIRGAWNIPLSKALEELLEKSGYRHSRYIYPPCDMSFRPRPKVSRIVQVTRIVPHKRLEEFMEIARRLPHYKFLIVGSISETERHLNPGYAERLLKQLPSNVKYVETRIRDSPELLEESMVYLYTSHEPGINISTAQAAGAGCIPITPVYGGGAELVRNLGAGYCYANLQHAVACIIKAIENPEWSVQEISSRAKVFSSERFRENIKNIVSSFIKNPQTLDRLSPPQ